MLSSDIAAASAEINGLRADLFNMAKERDKWMSQSFAYKEALNESAIDLQVTKQQRDLFLTDLRAQLAAMDKEWSAIHKAIGQPSIEPGSSLADAVKLRTQDFKDGSDWSRKICEKEVVALQAALTTAEADRKEAIAQREKAYDERNRMNLANTRLQAALDRSEAALVRVKMAGEDLRNDHWRDQIRLGLVGPNNMIAPIGIINWDRVIKELSTPSGTDTTPEKG